MTVRFRDPNHDRSARFVITALAALHFLLAGMLLYLRWGPLERALQAFTRQGVEIPAWLSLGVTLGTVLMALFLAVRGLLALRKAWKADPGAQETPEDS